MHIPTVTPTTRLGNVVVPQASSRHWPRRLPIVRRLVDRHGSAHSRNQICRLAGVPIRASHHCDGGRKFLFVFESLGSANAPFADKLSPDRVLRDPLGGTRRVIKSVCKTINHHRALPPSASQQNGTATLLPAQPARHVSQTHHHSHQLMPPFASGREGSLRAHPSPVSRPAFGPSMAGSLSCDYAFWRKLCS